MTLDNRYSGTENSYFYDYTNQTKNGSCNLKVMVEPNTSYLFSFDAFISSDANMSSSSEMYIMDVHQMTGTGFSSAFIYKGNQKGYWRHYLSECFIEKSWQ